MANLAYTFRNRRGSLSFLFIVVPLVLLSLYLFSFSSFPTGVSALQHDQIPAAAPAMVKYIITLKSGASADEYDKAKKQAVSEGGKIVDEYTLIKGFVVEFPSDTILAMASNDKLNVEKDQEVTTQ